MLEVLIAAGILAIGFSAIFALLSHGATTHRSAFDRTVAATLAASVFDDVALRYHSAYLPSEGDAPAAFADRNGNGVPDRFETFGRPTDDYPHQNGYRYTLRVLPSAYTQHEVFVICSVSWQTQGQAHSQSFHRLVFVK